MNKLILLLLSILLLNTSCSENENTTPTSIENSKPLPKTIEEVNTTNGSTTTFTYNDNKLLEIAGGGIYLDWVYKIVYTYTGDLITKEIGYLGNGIVYTTEYTYENDKLKTVLLTYDHSTPEKSVYTYESENVVKIETYTTSYSIDIWQLAYNVPTVRINFNKGNILFRENLDKDGNVTSAISYEYDKNPNIFTNILGFDKLFFKNSYPNNFYRYFHIENINNVNNVTFYKEYYGALAFSSDRVGFNYGTNSFPSKKLEYYNFDMSRVDQIFTYY